MPIAELVTHKLSHGDSPSTEPVLLVGRKYVRLYHPKYTQQLYPHESGMHTNTSQVDLDAVDEHRFPDFAGTPFTDVVLQPGDMLYMPPKHWHYVRSLSASFSVSFWWS
jgi:lysine-specific demethylase 8